MKASLIEQIIRENISIGTDSEQSPIIEGVNEAAEMISKQIENFKIADALIKQSNLNDKLNY